jgi:mannan endo-1,4-beta-mannosidase
MHRCALHISWAALVLSLTATAGCKNDATPSSKTLDDAAPSTAETATNLSVTRYDPDAFCYKWDAATKQNVLKPECQPPAGSGLSYSDGIAVAEGLFGLTCEDNFVDVDLNAIPDVEQRDIDDARGWYLSHIKSKFDYLKEAYKQCADVCVHVRKVDGKDVYSVNLPRCSGWQGKTYELATNQAKGSKTVFAQSACPARHWKNVAKERFGKGIEAAKNHCAHPTHIDISTKIAAELGVTDATQNQTLATMWLPGTQPPDAAAGAGSDDTSPAPPASPSAQTAAVCDDIAPDSKFTCAEQAGFGQCDQAFMQGRCNLSCGRCSLPDPVEPPPSADGCSDIPPDDEFGCQQQAEWGKCDDDFMKDFCHRSCGRC